MMELILMVSRRDLNNQLALGLLCWHKSFWPYSVMRQGVLRKREGYYWRMLSTEDLFFNSEERDSKVEVAVQHQNKQLNE